MAVHGSAVKPYRGMGMEGAVARWYAALTRNSLNEFKSLAERISRQIPSHAKVLEVAPGPGYFAIELAKFGNCHVTGLDISETFVDIARANAADAKVTVDFHRGNASEMPFADGSFDFVLCRAAFKNFSEPARALEEIYRVLKPGGKALIIDLRRDASMQSIRQAVKEMNVGALNEFITRLTFRHMLLKRAYTKSEFEGMVAQTKFTGVKIEENPIGLEILLSKHSTDFLSWAYFTLNGASWRNDEEETPVNMRPLLAVPAAAI